MNARDRGHEEGFAVVLSSPRITRGQLEMVARHYAGLTYVQIQKQQEYFEGFMENYHEPHPVDCTCKDCQDKPEILTF